MRRLLGRLVIVGAAAGAVIILRNYLRDTTGAKKGDVQIVLDDGVTTIEPEPVEAREFIDIARKVLEIDGT